MKFVASISSRTESGKVWILETSFFWSLTVGGSKGWEAKRTNVRVLLFLRIRDRRNEVPPSFYSYKSQRTLTHAIFLISCVAIESLFNCVWKEQKKSCYRQIKKMRQLKDCRKTKTETKQHLKMASALQLYQIFKKIVIRF